MDARPVDVGDGGGQQRQTAEYFEVPNLARLQQEQRKQEYARALDQPAHTQQPRPAQHPPPPRGSERDHEQQQQAYHEGNAMDAKRQQQLEYAQALGQQQLERDRRDKESRESRFGGPERGGGGGGALDAGDPPGANDRRRQQQEYAAALEQQMADRRQPGRRGQRDRDDSGGGDVFGGGGGEREVAARRQQQQQQQQQASHEGNAMDAKRQQQLEYAQALGQQQLERDRRDKESRESRFGGPERGGGGGGALDAGDPPGANDRRRQQQEYAAALEQQMADRRQPGRRGQRDRDDSGGGDVFGGGGGEREVAARRQQQQQQQQAYAAELEGQMAARQSGERRGAPRIDGTDEAGGGNLFNGGGGEREALARRRQQQEYAAALEEQMADRKLKERTTGGAFTLGRDDESRTQARRGAQSAYAQELQQQVSEERDRKAAEKARAKADRFEAAGGVLGGVSDRDPRFDGPNSVPSPTVPPATDGFSADRPKRVSSLITRPDGAPELVAARQQQQAEMQAALKAQVDAKSEEKRRRQQLQLEEEQREMAKLEKEREELRAQFEKEQADRRMKEKAKLEKERGLAEPVASPTSAGGNHGAANGAGDGRNTCMTYDERVAQKAADYHRKREERERAEASSQGVAQQLEQGSAQQGEQSGTEQQARRRGSAQQLEPGSAQQLEESATDQQSRRRGSRPAPVARSRLGGNTRDAEDGDVPRRAAHMDSPPVPSEAWQEVEELKQMHRQLQQAQQQAAEQAAQLQQQAAQLQAAQADQARVYEQQQAQAAQAQAELHRQNDELRAAMADQYNRVQEEARMLEQKFQREQEQAHREQSQPQQHLHLVPPPAEAPLRQPAAGAFPPQHSGGPPSRCGTALSDSVLRTPYHDASFQPPPRPELPVPPPEVEAALARLRLPGVATAAVAGEAAAVDRGWSPLVELSAEEEYRRDIGSLAPPAPHPALHGPMVDASVQADATLRGASELVYPSDDTLRRSLDAQQAGKAIATAKASGRLGSAARLGVPPPLPPLEEADEPDRRPRSHEGSRRGPTSGGRPGSSPTQVPSLQLGSISSSPPGTPGLDTLVRHAEERLRQLQLVEVTPEAPAYGGAGRLGGSAQALMAATGADADGTLGPGTLRASLPARSAYVPLDSGAPRALADGELPEWLRPNPTHGGTALRAVDGGPEESRDALMSRGSQLSAAESTTVAIVKRTEQQLRRLGEYEHAVAGFASEDVAAGELPRGHPARGPGAMRSKAVRDGLPPASPADVGDASGGQGVEERLQWLRQLESQLGMEGIVIDPPAPEGAVRGALHPDSYDVAARIERVERREAAMKEAEELDELLLKYLEK